MKVILALSDRVADDVRLDERLHRDVEEAEGHDHHTILPAVVEQRQEGGGVTPMMKPMLGMKSQEREEPPDQRERNAHN